jgi:hypothetical protein
VTLAPTSGRRNPRDSVLVRTEQTGIDVYPEHARATVELSGCLCDTAGWTLVPLSRWPSHEEFQGLEQRVGDLNDELSARRCWRGLPVGLAAGTVPK